MTLWVAVEACEEDLGTRDIDTLNEWVRRGRYITWNILRSLTLLRKMGAFFINYKNQKRLVIQESWVYFYV